jgi:hypothetical protein
MEGHCRGLVLGSIPARAGGTEETHETLQAG